MRRFLITLSLLLTGLSFDVEAQDECGNFTCPQSGPVFEVGSCTGSNAVADNQAVQDAFCCARNGGTVLFPPGASCLYLKEIELINAQDFVIEGNGSILIADASAKTGNGPYGGIRIQNAENFEIRNLTVDGNRAARGVLEVVNHAVLLRDSRNGLLINVKAQNAVADGFHLKGRLTPPGASQPEEENRLKLIGCTAENNGRHGVALTDVTDVQILGGAFSGNNGLLNTAGVPFTDGIRIETHGNSAERITNVLVSGATLADNYGSAIHVQEAPGTITEDIRVLDNFMRNNLRHALRLRGRRIEVRGNRIFDHPEGHAIETQRGAILIRDQTQNLTFADNDVEKIGGILMKVAGSRITIRDNHFRDLTFTSGMTSDASIRVVNDPQAAAPPADITLVDNTFEDIETGIDVIAIDSGVERPAVIGNHFSRINRVATPVSVGGSRPTLIRSAAAETRIAGNQVWESENRGIHLSATTQRSLVANNQFYGMVGNVIWIHGEDTRLSDNRIESARRSLGSSHPDDALVRVSGPGVTVNGNTFACGDGDVLQTGLLFELPALAITNNVVYGCHFNWLQQPTVPPLEANNLRVAR